MNRAVLALRARLNQLEALRQRVEADIRATQAGLAMYDDVLPTRRGGRRPAPSPFTYTDAEARAAHTLHAAGEDTPWVRDGERAYQRRKKRVERARKAAA